MYTYTYICFMKAAKENKKPVTLIIRPSIKVKAKKKADKEKTSLSQVVENLLEGYSK